MANVRALAASLVAAICINGITWTHNGWAQGSGSKADQEGAELRITHGVAPYPLNDELLQWPLAKENQPYGSIDGHKIWSYVNELAAISRRYHDAGHQYWGRITGTSADVETQQWVIAKLKKDGITDVKIQKHALPNQWLPKSWSLTVTAGGQEFAPATTFPVMLTSPTPAGGLDLPAIYVGTGSAADFIGRDVRGKIAVIYSNEQPAMWNNTAETEGGAMRAAAAGAAAVVIYLNLPVNATTALYPFGSPTHIPVLTVGSSDGFKIREMLAKSFPRIKMMLDVDRPNLETATIFATLPGASDEKIYVLSHRDAFFEGGSDNASGIAAMVGLADYFSKIPQKNRRRTIVFLSTTGHHNDCSGGDSVCTVSGLWIKDHAKELFAHTALIINCEHVATVQTYQYLGPTVRLANTQNEADFWYVNGSMRLKKLAYDTYRSFGVPTYLEPEAKPAGEMGGYYDQAPSLQLLDVGMFAHSDRETADVIPWTGLEGVTRAYAKIIDSVNEMAIGELQTQTIANAQAQP